MGAAAAPSVGVFLPLLSLVVLSARDGGRFRTQSRADLFEVTFWSALGSVLAGGVEAGEDRVFLVVVVVVVVVVRGRLLWSLFDGLSFDRLLPLQPCGNPLCLCK